MNDETITIADILAGLAIFLVLYGIGYVIGYFLLGPALP